LGIGALYLILRVGGAFEGNGQTLSAGWHWQNAAFSLWESLTCVAASYGILAIFRAWFNSHGKLAKFPSDNAFSVYVFHPPVVIIVARMLHGVMLPSVTMFMILTVSGATASFLLSAAVFRRISLLCRIL
jgi:surface polysaccharide O-acyltransferase-like enzyme